MKEAGAHCVKLEGGAEMAPVIAKCIAGGIPVMAHIGFTPQSEHTLGGYRVQGRGDAADRVLRDAHAVQEAGAFAVVMEMVPGDVATQVTKELTIPTIGIGAGNGCDGQVLVWQDAFGLRTGRMARFVKQYADVHTRAPRRRQGVRRRREDGHLPGSRAHLLIHPAAYCRCMRLLLASIPLVVSSLACTAPADPGTAPEPVAATPVTSTSSAPAPEDAPSRQRRRSPRGSR